MRVRYKHQPIKAIEFTEVKKLKEELKLEHIDIIATGHFDDKMILHLKRNKKIYPIVIKKPGYIILEGEEIWFSPAKMFNHQFDIITEPDELVDIAGTECEVKYHLRGITIKLNNEIDIESENIDDFANEISSVIEEWSKADGIY
jgi:hypothetical protein